MNRIPIKLIEESPDGTKAAIFDDFSNVADAKRAAKQYLDKHPMNTYTAIRTYGRWGLKTTSKTVLTDLEVDDASEKQEAGERREDGKGGTGRKAQAE